MKIKVLNESFLKKEHLEILGKLGTVELLLDTDTPEKAKERIKDADIVIADMFVCPLTKEVLEEAEQLKLIAINTTAFEKVDTKFAKQKDILVANVPTYSTDSVAEHVFALLFSLLRKLESSTSRYKNLPFVILPDCLEHRKFLGFNLRGKTLGVVGLGNIGQRVCEIANAFGMNVIAYNRSQKNISSVKQVSFEELLEQSGVISVHVAANEETKNMFNKKAFEQMKDNVILINTAGSETLNIEDLTDSLKKGEVQGAGLDTVGRLDKNHPLLTLENVVITPQVGWFTEESLQNMAEIITSNVENFVQGNPKNIVN